MVGVGLGLIFVPLVCLGTNSRSACVVDHFVQCLLKHGRPRHLAVSQELRSLDQRSCVIPRNGLFSKDSVEHAMRQRLAQAQHLSQSIRAPFCRVTQMSSFFAFTRS